MTRKLNEIFDLIYLRYEIYLRYKVSKETISYKIPYLCILRIAEILVCRNGWQYSIFLRFIQHTFCQHLKIPKSVNHFIQQPKSKGKITKPALLKVSIPKFVVFASHGEVFLKRKSSLAVYYRFNSKTVFFKITEKETQKSNI